MPDVGPEHPLSYRHEVVAPLFQTIRAGDSCAVVGPAGMGKSRLIQFVQRLDVQQHYLGDQADTMLLALVDCNRLAEISEWGLYELLLTVLTEESGVDAGTQPLRSELNTLRREAITSRDAILARRHAELAVHMLCQERGRKLCFLLDEFDESYRSLPATALANLRALRDANKYWVCYALMLREHPARLRDLTACEGFYELFSRTVLGLRPYSSEDAAGVIAQLERRKGHELTAMARGEIVRLSGGHPGLLVALFDLAIREEVPGDEDWQAWAVDQPVIYEECRKIWAGLAEDERLGLGYIAQGLDVDNALRDLLALKGLILTTGQPQVLFSPLFAHYVLAYGAPAVRPLMVDEAARLVWLGERRVSDLTAREFDLLAYLFQHAGKMCTRDQLLDHLYPEETHDANDNRVDTLVKRVREKIEPVRQRPRYLLTVRGKGYKLVATPE